MKWSRLLAVVLFSSVVVACAQGEEPGTKVGAGGSIVGGTGGTGGLIGTGGKNAGSGGTGGSSTADCSASTYTDPTCGSCMESQCASQCNACLTSSDCSSWLSCVLNCSDTVCDDSCAQQYPAGETLGLAWLGTSGCISTQCGSSCTSGSSCGLSTGGAVPECDTCIESSCCAQGAACGNDQACVDMVSCINNCNGDTTCEDSCLAASSSAAQELNNFYSCLNQYCVGSC